jgi:ABC-type amino acid transport substrate-binding protein
MNKKIITGVVVLVLMIGFFLIFNLNRESEATGEVVDTENSLEEKDAEARELYIVTSPWEPYMYEEDGVYKGLSVEILDKVMTKLDISYKFEIMPWSRALKMVQFGEADGTLTAAYADDRADFILYTPDQIEYAKEGGILPESTLVESKSALFVKKENVDLFVFDSEEQIILDQYKIGLNQNYAYSELDPNDPRLNKEAYVDEQDAFQALMDGDIDVYLAEKLVSIAILKKMGLEDEVTYIDKTGGETGNALYILFGKNSNYPNIQQIARDSDRVIAEMKENGEYDEIYERYA